MFAAKRGVTVLLNERVLLMEELITLTEIKLNVSCSFHICFREQHIAELNEKLNVYEMEIEELREQVDTLFVN